MSIHPKKVSVCVMTYNHARFIRQCLQSIVDQKTRYDFEVIVGDDCSTDGTSSIVQEFAEKYPDLVRPLIHATNVGATQNYFAIHHAAQGEYIAHVDGDDYLLPDKLQTQSDLLDAHPSLTICWHRMEMFNEKGMRRPHPVENAPYMGRIFTVKELLLFGPFGPHSSMMYRRDRRVLRTSPEDIIDWQISVEIIGDGQGLMLRDVLGCYRLHPGGMSTGATANQKTRMLIAQAQIRFMKRFPQHKSAIALRALFVTLMDAVKLKGYFTKSLRVLLAGRTFPDLTKAGQLIEFYRYSKLPPEFK